MPASPDTCTPTARGRRRTEKFLDAAREVFIEQGYDAASVNEIVRRAGGSLATLYKRFGNKEGLFLAMIEQRALIIFATLEKATLSSRAPQEALQDYGRQLLTLLLTPDALAIYRLVINEAHRHPHMAREFLEHGPFRVRRALAAYLETQCERGLFEIDDCWQAAAELSGMLLSDIHIQALVGLPSTLDPATLDRRIAGSVKRFLYGIVVD